MARIAIPEAPLRGGAVARPLAPVVDQTGEAFARLGERISQAAAEIDRSRLDVELARERVTTARELGRTRLDYERETDPDAIDAGFQQRTAELRAAAIARVDPRNAEAVGLGFDELRDRHAVQLGARAIGLQQERTRGALAYQETAVLAEAAPVDPATAGALVDQYVDSVAAAVDRGHLTPEEGATRINALRADVASARALRLLDEAPDALVVQIDAGAFAELAPVERERLRVNAGRELQRREAASAAEEARRGKETATLIEARLAEVRDLARAGRRVPDEETLLADPLVQSVPGFAEAAGAIALRDALPEFNSLTPDQMSARIAEERRRPADRRFELKTIEAMEDAREAAVKRWREDAIAYAPQIGFNAPPALPEDLGDARAVATAVAARRAYGRSLAEQGYVAEPQFFSVAERARLAEMTGASADPAARVALAGALAAGFAKDAPRALEEIGAGPVFQHFGALIAAGGAPGVAERAFRGETALAGDVPVTKLPVADERRRILDATVGPSLLYFPAYAQQVLAAADALYGELGRGLDPKDAPDDAADAYAEAIQLALGRSAVTARDQAGGVQELNGRLTLLPLDVTPAQVNRALGRALAANNRRPSDVAGAASAEGVRRAALDLWSRSGRGGGDPVYADSQALDPDDMDRVTLTAEADGLYALQVRGRDILDSQTGELFVLDLRRFVRETDRFTEAVYDAQGRPAEQRRP